MSQSRALTEIERFLSTANAEVLSISGRWGVGKTYAWDTVLKAKRDTTPVRQYAYVSAFGLRSLDALKTAIVQSTVSLDGKELEPTVESLVAHLSSIPGLRKMGEEVTRKGLGILQRGASAIPYVGKLADLVAPGAALLIRNQIVCIDDIERAGQGLDVGDILGLVSSLRERRNCKVVLLLNEDGLDDQASKFREYLEKVVDQAIKFEPTPKESAAAALRPDDPMAPQLRARTEALGIINIRVIRRIRRFLGHIEPELAGLHPGVTDQVIHSIALLGWCVFEPKVAPALDRVRRFSRFAGLIGQDNRLIEEKQDDLRIQGYGFHAFTDVDTILLDGLRAGAFDRDLLAKALKDIDRGLTKDDAYMAIAKPWSLLEDSFDDNLDEFLDALVASIEEYASAMSPADASDALAFLREFGRPEAAARLLPTYIQAQEGKAREFFAHRYSGRRRPIDPAIAAAFETKLAQMPLVKDPGALLVEIGSQNGWNPEDIDYLATVPVEEYRALLRRLRGNELSLAISVALRFGVMNGASKNDRELASRMSKALRLIAEEGPMNKARVAPYHVGESSPAEAGQAQTTNDASDVLGPAAP